MRLAEIKKQIKEKKQRLCKKCNELKPVSEFHIKKGKNENQYRFNSPCKKCGLKDKQLKYTSFKNWRLIKLFGITQAQYNEMLLKQNYSCAICHTHVDSFSKDLAVDHCHTTGKVRGLLCSNCNLGIGNFKDDITLLNTAIEYIKSHKFEEL